MTEKFQVRFLLSVINSIKYTVDVVIRNLGHEKQTRRTLICAFVFSHINNGVAHVENSLLSVR